ncbi:MAG: hypothetical protein HUU01_03140 [Saprospiraceae bacterium]|nr:hypothetical protein [Saprospiraceae bacterium]
MTHLFGIRHHGPGSAKRLVSALRHLQPDCLLIEVPSDAEAALSGLLLSDMTPPVALLLYNAIDLSQASWLPFASFSPEWQAMVYGHAQQIPVVFMDLPMAVQFALDEKDKENLLIPQAQPESNTELLRDPMGYMAQLAGYPDTERWWDAAFEQNLEADSVFDLITEMMIALREKKMDLETPETLLREAFMRQTLRKIKKKGFQRIAVVCGAWHTPALHNLKAFDAKKDAALLRGLPKMKIKHTWIPWTYERLALQSGYGAGVISPAWYEQLFHSPAGEVVGHWMVQVARLLRAEGLEASAAHATEAVRLAGSLAALRERPLPGLEELEEAALAVFCGGSALPLELIRKKLVIGDKAGHVPDKFSSSPLQRDLDERLKAARLQKYWGTAGTQWLKATSANPQGGIDLREAADLLKSQLLYQLNLLDIPWGVPADASGGNLGTFRELWKLHWQPEFLIRLIEAAMWGNSIEEAADARTQRRAADLDRLPELSDLTLLALKAGLGIAPGVLIRRLSVVAAIDRDVFHLMDCLPTLINITRYGDVRKTDATAISALIEEFIPRICIALPGACTGIDEAAAQEVLKRIFTLQRAIHLPGKAAYNTLWETALLKTTEQTSAHPLLRGACARMLFEEKIETPEQTGKRMYFALSKGQATLTAAWWIEGFLHGSGLLLIHQPALWSILDQWLSSLDDLAFTEALPMLRRTFSGFSKAERRKMLSMASGPGNDVFFSGEPFGIGPLNPEEDAARLLLGLS